LQAFKTCKYLVGLTETLLAKQPPTFTHGPRSCSWEGRFNPAEFEQLSTQELLPTNRTTSGSDPIR
jgi:hypothetical protein